MATYELRITLYEAPDRGDPNGGWRPRKSHVIDADGDAEAKQKALDYLKKKYEHYLEHPDEMRTKLFLTREIPLA